MGKGALALVIGLAVALAGIVLGQNAAEAQMNQGQSPMMGSMMGQMMRSSQMQQMMEDMQRQMMPR